MFCGSRSAFSDVNAISRPSGDHAGLKPSSRQAPDGLAGAPHHEDAAAIPARSKRNALAIRRKRRLIVIVDRIRCQIDRRLPGRALKKDVSIALAVASVDDPFAVGREPGKPLESGLRRNLCEGRLQALGWRPAHGPVRQTTTAITRRRRAQHAPSAARFVLPNEISDAAKRTNASDRAIASSSSTQASPISRRRRSTSFARHRRSRRRTLAGVAAGSSRQSGSRVENGRDRVGHRLTIERFVTGEHLVEHAAKRPDVGALVDGFSSRLLGTHVGGGSEDDAVSWR